ncbi:MAG: hypothetical protein K9L62_02225 [Vallitaleaceae bacterium]|nr:hypothetical protein [Vallitaleaceae bacterium]
MLTITIPEIELFDDVKQEFTSSKAQTIQLEHSLVSLSKWESKWLKPFLSKEKKTATESIDYIKCMTITQKVDPEVYQYLPKKILDEVSDYIDAPMTATTIKSEKTNGSREIVTSELIYYWMIALNIPFECQKWHLNRLLTLINVCDIKTRPPKKMNKKEIINRNKALNAARRKSANTTG